MIHHRAAQKVKMTYPMLTTKCLAIPSTYQSNLPAPEFAAYTFSDSLISTAIACKHSKGDTRYCESQFLNPRHHSKKKAKNNISYTYETTNPSHPTPENLVKNNSQPCIAELTGTFFPCFKNNSRSSNDQILLSIPLTIAFHRNSKQSNLSTAPLFSHPVVCWKHATVWS